MTGIDWLRCTWDFRDRLVAVEDNATRAEYRYDYTGRRVLKKVFWKQGEPTTGGRPATTATSYIGKHFEVRDHDQPVKYVFSGSIRVAKITGSLSSNLRVQRLRIHAGWNLVSLAVTLSDARAQLFHGAIESAYFWNPANGGYAEIQAGQVVTAGSVLWLKSNTNGVIALVGDYVEPMSRNISAGPGFVPAAGLEAWPLDLPPLLSAWYYDAASRSWQNSFTGDLASLTDLPATLAPGEAIFVQADEPVELSIPEPTSRILYYHQDHLGSSSAITDANGALVEETANYPFGIPRHEHRSRAVQTHYGFIQKERDRESRLHYFESRYLAGALSRFVTADPKYANPESLSSEGFASFLSNPQQINLYAYALNNPVAYTDPSGFSPQFAGTTPNPEGYANYTRAFGEGLAFSASAGTKGAAILALGAVNAILGTSPANAPARGGKTYESVGPGEHVVDAVVTLGGGKLIAWGGNLIRSLRGAGVVAAEGGAGAIGAPPVIANTAALADTAVAGAPVAGPSIGATAATTQRGRSLIAVAETQFPVNASVEAARQAQLASKWAYIERRLAETAAERAAAMELFNRGYSVKGAGHIIKMIGDEANAIFGLLNLAD